MFFQRTYTMSFLGIGSTSSRARAQKKSISERFAIADRFKTIEEVTNELQQAGLESSDLILAVDWTRSNQWQGKSSFGGTSLSARIAFTEVKKVWCAEMPFRLSLQISLLMSFYDSEVSFHAVCISVLIHSQVEYMGTEALLRGFKSTSWATIRS